jgi:hypothetical protein
LEYRSLAMSEFHLFSPCQPGKSRQFTSPTSSEWNFLFLHYWPGCRS